MSPFLSRGYWQKDDDGRNTFEGMGLAWWWSHFRWGNVKIR